MKRFAAMLVVSVLMVLWIASGDRMSAGQRTDGLYYEVTGIHPDAVLMRIEGEDISAEEYWLMSAAAGCMVCVTAQEMIPQAVEEDEPAGVVSIVLGFALMMALDVAL